MITNVHMTTVFCLDQDAARDFWVGTLGFEVRTDITVGDGFRWLAVGHPSQPELDVVLMVPGPPLDEETVDMIKRQLAKGQMNGPGLHVDDCRKTYEELKAKGVEFLQEPSDRPYGVEALMRDNSGNWLVLVEPRAFTPADFT